MLGHDIARPELASAIRIRPAGVGDERGVAAMARALSRNSIRRRFLAVVAPEVAADELRRETRCEASAIALVAEDAGGAIVGEAYAASLGATCVEAAFVVADRVQHQGIGTRLFGALVRTLSERGVRTMLLETLADNAEMVDLVRTSGLPHTMHRVDDSIEITVELPPHRRHTLRP
jgi:acetyltransferase